jgi:riboflavin kinase/FMN adenylyltransferase
MTCHRDWDAFRDRPPRSTRVTWGVYDGVHLGHQAVFDALAAWARGDGVESVVITFDPHPQAFLHGSSIPLVMPVPERARLIASRGIDTVLVLPFDKSLAEMTADRFFSEVLAGRAGAGGILIGYDSRFGRRGEGGGLRLRELAAGPGIPIRTCEPRLLEGRPVKSSGLREAIARGDLTRARAMTGRPVCLVGPVVPGDHRGRTMGYPTANLDCRGLVLPPNGVYAIRGWERGAVAATPCRDAGETGPLDGVMNIGVRPTFDGPARVSVEAHFLDLPAGQDLYGRTMRIEAVARIRGEMRFPGVEELKAQIEADCRAARAALAGR